MTKKLTKVAMTTALAAAAIVPAVVATPAQAAEAEVTFAKAYYTTANGTAAFEAGKLGVVISTTKDTNVTYVEGSNGEVFDMKTFSAYFAGNKTATTNEILTALSKAGKALSADQVKALNVKKGTVEDDKVVVDPTAVQKTALEEAIAKAEASPKAAELKDAIAAAKAVAAKADATQAEVDAAVKALNEAIAKAEAATELKVESVKAINKTTVQLTLSKEVDTVTATNFTIAGGNVTAASLAADKKTVTLAVSGLNYATEYTVQTKDIVVNGTASNFGSKTFTTKAVTELWELQISTLDASLLADGSDNTEVTFKLVDKTTGQVDVNADNVVLDLNTTYGTLASKRVTVQDGVATVLLTSEFSNVDISTKVDAQIIEASGDYKDLINHVVGTTFVPFKTTTTENVDTVTLVSAEANQADRVTLFFDKEITLKHFVAANAKGELLYTQSGTPGDKVAKDLEKVDATLISHKLIKAGNVKISQGANENFTIKGFKPVAGNSKAIEVILDKTTVLKDNADVKIDVITTNSLKKETNSSANFKVTDARKPEATSVTTEGLNTLKVKFSEAIDASTFQIDGQYKGVLDGTVIDAAPTQNAAGVISGQNKNQAFTYEFGEFNPVTLADNRDLATIKLTAHYWEAGDKKLSGFFSAGSHTIQTSSTKDFASRTDSNNIGSTQNLNFTIAADTLKPTATVTVESPEQFRLKFDKAVSATEAQVQAFIVDADNSGKVKLQVKNATTGNYEDANGLVAAKGQVAKASDLKVTRISATEFIIELTKDWTKIHDTETTNKNYYNYEYRLLIAKDTFTNVANGLKNEELQLNLNYSGSALNTPDTTSPIISNVERVGTTDVLNVTMNEPVKLVTTGSNTVDNAGDTLAQGQSTLTTTTVQFLGKDKDGKTVTINGKVGSYVTPDNGSDSKFTVNWTGVTKTPQAYVDEGGSTEWTVVVRNISDDVGNDASSATFDISLEKSPAGDTPFFVQQYTALENAAKAGKHKVEGTGNGTGEDKVVITFSEGVQFTGNSDATNPANYTLNGVTLPTGTSIAVSDVVADTAFKGLETVTITLPDGTLNIGANVSNVITINKNLVSHDNSKIQGETTLIVIMDENDATNAVVTAEGTKTTADVNAAQTLVTALPADVAPATTKADLQARLDVVKAQIAVTAYENLALTSDSLINTAVTSKAGAKEGATAAIAALPVADRAAFNSRVTTKDTAIDTAATVATVTIPNGNIGNGAGTSLTVTGEAKNAAGVVLTTGVTYAWTVTAATDAATTVNTAATSDLVFTSPTAVSSVLTKALAADAGDTYTIQLAATKNATTVNGTATVTVN